MFVRIGSKEQADFEHPIALLKACHRRVERFLDELLVVARLGGRPLDQVHAEALAAGLDYFRVAAPRHTEDEERSVFPRLRGALADDAPERQRLIELEQEHKDLEPEHAGVERLGRLWLEARSLNAAAAAMLLAHLERLRATYTVHIKLEEEAVFPLAAHLLSTEQLQEIGREMAERRAAAKSS